MTYVGSSRPILINSMRQCCLETLEEYIRTSRGDEEGFMLKCNKYPKQSNHRIYMRDGKWVGTWLTARH